MSEDDPLHTLSALAESLADRRLRVERASVESTDEGVEAGVRLALPLDCPGAVSVDADHEDGEVTIDVTTTVPDAGPTRPEEGAADQSDTGADPAPGGADDRDGDESGPAHRDPERLREVYEAHDTFSEMRDALDADVTAQTVRRNMMKHGIHEPETRDGSAGDASDASELPASVEFDGVTLPDDVRPSEVKEAVASSSSLHGAQQSLGLEMAETRSLLQSLGVLSYVTGRLDDHEGTADPDEIEQQIHESLTAHTDGGQPE